MYIDIAQLTGSAHVRQAQGAQDYAYGVQTEKGIRIALSDGCSSGGRTDVGARFIVEHLLRYRVPRWQRWYQDAQAFGLQDDDLLATALWAHLDTRGKLTGKIVGDGYVAVQWQDGTFAYAEVTWRDNTPLYPLYLVDQRRGQAFLEQHAKATDACVVRTIWCTGTQCTLPETHTFAVEDAGDGLSLADVFPERTLQEVQYVALASDGVASVQQDRDPLAFFVSLLEVPKRRPGHVQRRVAFWHTRRGMQPIDDLSLVVAWRTIEKEQEDGKMVGTEATVEGASRWWHFLYPF